MSRKDKGGGEGICYAGPFPQVIRLQIFSDPLFFLYSLISWHVKDNHSRGTVLSGFVTKTRNGERGTGNERGERKNKNNEIKKK